MPDDKSRRGPPDSTRVNVHEDYEVRYWCGKWGCTAADLRAAVAAVGVSSSAVEAWLRRNGKTR